MALWYGHTDDENSADFTAARMKELQLGRKQIGMEKDHAFFKIVSIKERTR